MQKFKLGQCLDFKNKDRLKVVWIWNSSDGPSCWFSHAQYWCLWSDPRDARLWTGFFYIPPTSLLFQNRIRLQ